MFELFQWGENIYSTLMNIGDFLLYKPFSQHPSWGPAISDFLRFYQIGDFLGPSDGVVAFFENLTTLSIGGMVFGAGLVGILGFKLVSFIIDLLP